MSMTRIVSQRQADPDGRTAGSPYRKALIAMFCLGSCALPLAAANAQHAPHGGGGFHGGGGGFHGGGGGFHGGGSGFRGGGFHGDFHGHDFNHFSPGELHSWRGGMWRHEWHDGRFAWWWIVNGGWYWYPEPVWPYPTYVAPPIIVQPPPPVVAGVPPVQFWYYCDNPRGYYPNVATCSVPWRAVPVTSPGG